eukprot:CAMPEP_0180524976 /NCGR_PEP_ID=MMETSP1036_2-20121128/58916_1 /TAXON_ID=632150 /ORGANISM="Azadinium spinosum, Strain 3D9" /LENGTH=79 /DNA_ID=CAMNT_0022538233 /DNA_START=11 /DNA_END=247 /DNA_ORIENTATION=+
MIPGKCSSVWISRKTAPEPTSTDSKLPINVSTRWFGTTDWFLSENFRSAPLRAVRALMPEPPGPMMVVTAELGNTIFAI